MCFEIDFCRDKIIAIFALFVVSLSLIVYPIFLLAKVAIILYPFKRMQQESTPIGKNAFYVYLVSLVLTIILSFVMHACFFLFSFFFKLRREITKKKNKKKVFHFFESIHTWFTLHLDMLKRHLKFQVGVENNFFFFIVFFSLVTKKKDSSNKQKTPYTALKRK